MEFIKNLDLFHLFCVITSLVIAIVGHEIMHGWVAYKFGDSTAKNLGRLSPNPIKHVDPLGTIVVPLMLYFTTGFSFGWAKPVPVRMDIVERNGGHLAGLYVSLAGVFYNFALSVFGLFLVINFGEALGKDAVNFIVLFSTINLFLAVFNLYPVPGFDGFKAIYHTLCMAGFKAVAEKLLPLERYGMIILVVLMISGLWNIFFEPARSVIKLFLAML